MTEINFWGNLVLLAGGGTLIGIIARRAANHWREGMGIGLWQPAIQLLAPPADPTGKDPPSLWHATSTAAWILIGCGIAAWCAVTLGFDGTERIWLIIFTSLMLVAAAVDQKHYFIPDPVVFLLLALGLARCFSFSSPMLLETDFLLLQDAALGLLAAYGFSVLLQSLFDLLGKQAFFWGDLKYSMALGLWMGFPTIIWLLLIASLLGMAYSLLTKRRYFPFAPFLSLAAFILLFANDGMTRLLIAPWL